MPAARPFVDRHIGPSTADHLRMLETLGYSSIDELIDAVVPASIREVDLDQPGAGRPVAASEEEVAAELVALAGRNRVLTPMIGLGYSDTVTPAVIRRNVLENPSWYTAYTPYQPEISQGRLEALLNFQTMVSDLTGLPVANASLLDEATAAAEAISLLRRAGKGDLVVIDEDALPQSIAVVTCRVEATGGSVVVADPAGPLPDGVTAVLVQYPGASGRVPDLDPVIAAAHDAGAQVAVAADLLSLALLVPPGEVGADVVVGSSQRFGVPLGFGGPHAAFMAIREGLQRNLPGRLVGVSLDADGQPAFRLALQTREQHIRRDKATSNICTAQVLLAVMASMYAVYHGPEGIEAIARHAHASAARVAESLSSGGVRVVHDCFFDTVLAAVPGRAAEVVATARQAGINLRPVDDDLVAVACDERTTVAHLEAVAAAFGVALLPSSGADRIPVERRRTSAYLTHPVFSAHRSETAMLRYLRQLADKDFALDRGMIPLGSCTMKLNATTEMEPVSLPGFAGLHPFAPPEDTAGYRQLIGQLEAWLAEITGYDQVSVQPNAGSQGELAGLLAIRDWHRSRGDERRDVCLIPTSAHGTNPASAAMAGMRVVPVACDRQGNVDLDDLRSKADAHAADLSALMITYPSTHGVFEPAIDQICSVIHDHGGQVYLDGANLNALVGLARPGRFGADVSHLNLHKTFCIPHGGGGPGVGPVAVRRHLSPFLPNHPLSAEAGPVTGEPIAAAPWGSAGILPISWAYIRLMGWDGLRRATEAAILSANYLARRLDAYFPVLYAGDRGLVAHECILDLRPLTKETGVTVDDVAKRLMDYGFHAPTMSFPVAGTLMVEPTESESIEELDRFVEAMAAIRAEIDRIAAGEWDAQDNPLRQAPHTAECIAGEWPHAYSRTEAAYPLESSGAAKYWPPVRRIDGAYGDRNLVCSCPPVADYV
ncbi:MAG TPA: aminomethyl-transferring glycine dehydrogenase [Acidimicrobiales bacterium]|nr:aminomethyl-transferring glycine dehydrogenase [Acidimicrobiales bacterium]